jgi:hypothetical protein
MISHSVHCNYTKNDISLGWNKEPSRKCVLKDSLFTCPICGRTWSCITWISECRHCFMVRGINIRGIS